MKTAKSYFIHVGSLKIDVSVIAKNIELNLFESFKIKQATFIFGNNSNITKLNKYTIIDVGVINNKSQILNNEFTIEKIKLIDGVFALFVFDDSTLYFYTSLAGNIPGYLIQQNDETFITSELKAFRSTNYFTRKLILIENYKYTYTNAISQNFSLLQNCKKIIPGVLYEMGLDAPCAIKTTTLKEITSTSTAIDFEVAKKKLHHLLDEAICVPIASGKPIALSLSGGVDSGTILGLLSKYYKEIHTFSIGTEFGNEYAKAKISADYCQSQHHEIFINEKTFCEGLLHSVYYNELCDPLYAEGFVAFYHFFKQASKYSDTCFTGYGADLILGNMHQTKTKSDINKINADWCKRTSWTGELNSYLANSFNCEMHFPFWNEGLIQFALSLPIECIQNNNTEKIILRSMSEEMKFTHPDIAWNKKTALTHGTSLDKVFSKILSIENENSYSIKSIFLYFLYEDFFVNDKSISEINIDSLILKTKQYASTI